MPEIKTKVTALWRSGWAILLAFALAEAGAYAQAPAKTQGGPREPLGNKDGIAQHVTRPYGEYNYLPQEGLYKDVTLGEVYEDFATAATRTASFIQNINRLTNLGSMNRDGELFWDVGAGVSGFGLPGFMAGYGSPFTGADPNNGYLSIMLGPLYFDSFYAGYGAIYNDINGSFPGIEQFPPDDRWGHIVWLSFRASLVLGNAFSVSISPYIYYLPNTGEVGWAIPGPFAGLMMPQFGTTGLLQIAWTKEIGNWQYVLFDQFTPFLAANAMFDVHFNGNANWGDMSPIYRVGRSAVGYGAGDTTNYDPTARYNGLNSNWDGLSGYLNIAGFRAVGTHGYSTRSLFYLNRFDFWDKDFRSLMASISGGAYIMNGDSNFSVYAGYDFTSAEPYDVFLNGAVVGVTKRISYTLSGFAQGGYFWYSGLDNNDSGWMGTVGLQHRLGYNTTQSFEAGRRVYRPATSAPGIEDYAQYLLTHQLTLRTNINFYAGITERHIKSNMDSDYVVKYAGSMLNTTITSRMNAFASAGYEKVEMEATNLIIDHWIYRLGLNYALSKDTQTNCFYQYEDVHGSTNYSEHHLYLGVTTRF